MSFRFYTNAISQASKGFARGMFITGLLLMGFAVIIMALPAIFAFLAAAVFFIAGFGCALTSVKIFLAQRRFDDMTHDDSVSYRKNVQIHSEEYHDI